MSNPRSPRGDSHQRQRSTHISAHLGMEASVGTFVSGLPVKHFWLPRKGLDQSGCAHLSDLGARELL